MIFDSMILDSRKQTVAPTTSARYAQAKRLQQQAADELAHAKQHVEHLILGVKNHDFEFHDFGLCFNYLNYA